MAKVTPAISLDRTKEKVLNIAPLLYWCVERENIRIRKLRGDAWPLTDDSILQKYRFCNLRREDDRETIWLRENIREPFADHPDLWWMICAFRAGINWSPTFQELLEKEAWPTNPNFKLSMITEVLEARKARKEKWHTSAYIIRPETSKSAPWYSLSKPQFIAEIVFGKLWENKNAIAPKLKNTLQEAHETLLAQYSFGPFIAYQCVVDLRFCKNWLINASDRETWCAAGPGTLRGLNRLYGRPVKQTLSQTQALSEIREIYAIMKKELSDIPFDFSDVANALCETDKYCRVKNGEGRPRSTYKPAKMFPWLFR